MASAVGQRSNKTVAPLGATEREDSALCQMLCRPSGAYVPCARKPTADAMGYDLTALRASGVRHSKPM